MPWVMLHYVGARAAGKVLSRAMRSEPPQQTTKNPVTQPSTLLLIKYLRSVVWGLPQLATIIASLKGSPQYRGRSWLDQFN